MSKYLKKFETTAAYEAAKDSLFKPNVSLVKDNAEVHYAPIIKVSGVSLNKSELSLAPNATETLVATVLPNDASNKSVTWSSSNQSVATVSSNGLVTAVGAGNATITVTTVDGGFTAQCSTNITVSVTGVTLNKSELSLAPNATETLVATVLPNDASNKAVTWSSSNQSVATVDASGVVTAVGDSGNATITVTTVDGGFTAQCAFSISNPCASEIVETTYEWVEIGGIKWATKNVGALTITDYGQKFSWGNVNGYTNEQVSGGCHAFSRTDDKYWTADTGSGRSGMTKYNKTDGLTTLQPSDDAATVNMGSGWRMPTVQEFEALCTATTSAWTTSYEGSGVKGMVFTSKADSSKKLFFPAAGYCGDGSVYSVGFYADYWSSSLFPTIVTSAYHMKTRSNILRPSENGDRFVARAVRGVLANA